MTSEFETLGDVNIIHLHKWCLCKEDCNLNLLLCLFPFQYISFGSGFTGGLLFVSAVFQALFNSWHNIFWQNPLSLHKVGEQDIVCLTLRRSSFQNHTNLSSLGAPYLYLWLVVKKTNMEKVLPTVASSTIYQHTHMWHFQLMFFRFVLLL